MGVTSPTLTFLPDLLEEHLEEIQFLWPIREAGLRSPRMAMRDVRGFEERIAAHADGALVPGDDAFPFIDPLLEADDPHAAFAAAFVLLRRGTKPALARVREAFAAAGGPRLRGIARALQVGPAAPLLDDLEAAFRSDDAARAVAAAEALGYHVRWKGAHDRLLAFLGHDVPAIRAQGWRVVANLGITAEPKRYAAAMRDEDPGVRAEALLAAAWAAVPGTLAIARSAAGSPLGGNVEPLRMLAALGEPGDLPALRRLLDVPALGPDRFDLAASFGSPAVVPLLLEHMTGTDNRDVIAAGEAFTRLTGANLGPGERVTLPPKDGGEPDEFEAEFLDEGILPDVAKARAHWDRVGAALAGAMRLAYGRDIAGGIPADAGSWLDMRLRSEWWMRARFRGTWSGSPMQLEVFPQRG